MARKSIPYPPSPPEVPPGLTRPSTEFLLQAALLIGSLFLFLLVYIGLMVLAVLAIRAPFVAQRVGFLNVTGAILCVFLLMFLVKGSFSRRQPDKTLHIEVSEEDCPDLFAFIHRLCSEVGAAYPYRVFVSPEVNAAVFYEPSLLNLLFPPRKKLLIGLGLVNSLNLSEFKAVLAHEFGHFRQKSFLNTYSYVAERIITDMVVARDWFDNMISEMQHSENLSILGQILGGMVAAVRGVMRGLLYAIAFLKFAVSRGREFNADLVAVSVCGSDAIVHGLLRSELAYVSLVHALEDLRHAADHHLYSADLLHHQNHAADAIRIKKKDPHWGEPPRFKGPHDGEDVQIFAKEEEDESDIPPMWRTHPSNHDREENAKAEFVAASIDNRSPWLLFGDSAELRARVAYRYYRLAYKVPKDVELAEPEKVQQFIDDEHAAVTYDPKYGGCYDERAIDPGDLNDAHEEINLQPWDDDRIENSRERLYDEKMIERAKRYTSSRQELVTILRECNFRPKKRTKRIVKSLEADLKDDREWLRSFDRRVYLVHVRMAKRIDPCLFQELFGRYRFHLALQQMHSRVAEAQDSVGSILEQVVRLGDQLTHNAFLELMHTLRGGRGMLKKVLETAAGLQVPAVANMKDGADLGRFLLEGRLISEPPLSSVSGKWINKLLNQLGEVRSKINRLDFKSLGAILELQDRIVAQWAECRAGSRPFAVPEVKEKSRKSQAPSEADEDEEGGVYKLRGGM